MSVQAETPPQKKKGKKILLILLALLLVAGMGIGGYIYSVGRAWDTNTEKFEDTEQAFPNEDGTVPEEDLEAFKKAVEAGEKAPKDADGPEGSLVAAPAGTEYTLENSEGKTLASDLDRNGNGIPDSIENGNWSRPADTAATNVLLLGSDTRGANNSEGVSGARADTIMVLHIPEDGSGAYVISVMRDTWVNIPGFGAAKINAALNYGGVALQVSAIEQLLNVRIDHVAEIEFFGFKKLVDTLGGVTVNNAIPFSAGPYTYTAGPNEMDGGKALVYVRQRYQFLDGDYQRVRNQRAFLRGVFNSLKSRGILSNATEFKSTIESIAPYMRVDNGLDAGTITQIASPMFTNPNFSMRMMTLPNAGTGWSYDGQSIVVVDLNANAALSNALNTGTMENYVATYGAD
ncbi:MULTISPECIES: LCP family protein [unclassified Rothia (in: high G+C Gram-positive bacteria)]|uniref:LCP family protein n=1 Tax=unclassified Rothia (in: high G+C Gram-positive bacteria) TaxID=2689056 RepID=UPI00195DC298|nr:MULTISPECIES: LCP family protein [unclassified Rothia (in: high G+C Gram-positive bacteria)]MBM7050573.1 LCP family protein [Rothia sp. ZJ1223]QRZ60765.1 LCP family protein [Rothia sp. ZJ932]